MTQQEFDSTRFRKGMHCMVQGTITGVSFDGHVSISIGDYECLLEDIPIEYVTLTDNNDKV